MPSIDDLIAKLSMVEDKAERAGIAIDKLTNRSAIQALQGGRSAILSGNMTPKGFTFNPEEGSFSRVQTQFARASTLIHTMMKQLDGFISLSRGMELSDARQIQKDLLEVAGVVNSVSAAAELAKRLNTAYVGTPVRGTGLLIDPEDMFPRTRAGYVEKLATNSEEMRGKTLISPRGGFELGDLVSNLTHELAHAIDEAMGLLNYDEIRTSISNQMDLARGQAQARLDKGGYSSEDLEDVMFREKFTEYFSEPREIFAREFASFAETGKTEIPELQGLFENLFNTLDKDLLDSINKLSSEANKAKEDIQKIFQPLKYVSEKIDAPFRTGRGDTFLESSSPGIKSAMQGADDLINQIREGRNKVINDIRGQLKETFRAAVPSGTPTEERLDKVVDDYIAGKLKDVSRVRVGGGSRVSLSKIRDELDKIISEGLGQRTEEARAVLATGGGGVRKPPGGIAISTEYPEGEKPGERRIPFGQQAPDSAQKLEEILKKVGTSLSDIGLKSEQLWDIMSSDIIQSGVEVDKVVSKLGKLKDGYQEIVTIVKTPSGGTRYFRGFVSEDLTQFSTELPKKILPTLEEQYNEIAGRLGGSFVNKLQEEIGQSQQAFRDIGIERVFDRVDVGVPVKLANGLERVNTVIYNGMVGLERYTLFLNQAKQAMTALQAEAYLAQQRQYTEPKLVESLGDVRARKALQLATAKGFDISQLKQVYTQEPTGVSFLKFQAQDAAGVVQKLEVTVDRFGNVLTRTNKRLLGFGEAIIRNTQEVLRWSIGVGLVYGSMYKLQELLRTAIDNEAKLADIAVVLGDAQRDLNTIFDEAAKVASETGESINDVLETYALAYRAVGAIEDPVQRSASAMRLLTDATVLNKLSSLDAATSIDVLAGALRQVQKPGDDMAETFERGTYLLDSWVQVSRKANVDLATLATAFSITAESAENSGLSIEQLNAIIASLAEKIGGLGGRETGNAVRALIGGIYQQQAAETLTQFGIASQDTAQRMRPFLEITREIYELNQAGIISDDQLNRIGYTLGGGVRRGQQYVAFLTDFQRIQQLVNEQTGIQGTAQEALGRKVDTVQTSITRLNNAFQNLAQTLGTSGGVLDVASGLLEIMTQLLNVTEGLTQVLGNIAIPAALLGVMGVAFRGETGALRKGALTAGVGGRAGRGVESILSLLGFTTPTLGQRLGAASAGQTQAATPAQLAGQKVGTFVSQNTLGVIAGIYPAIQRALSDDLTKPEKAIAVGSNIGGAIIGTVLAGGAPIGGVVGAAIADTFISATLAYQPDFNNFFVNAFRAGADAEEEELTDLQRKQQDIYQDVFKETGFGSMFEGIFRGRVSAFGFNISELFRTGQFGGMTPEQGALSTLGQRPDSRYAEYIRRIQEARYQTPIEIGESERETSAIQQRRIQLTKDEAQLLNQIAKSAKERLVIESATGKIRPKQFADISEVVGGFESTIPKLYEAFGEVFDDAEDSVSGLEETFKAFSDVLQYASEEDRSTLIALTNELFDLRTGLEIVESGARSTFLYKGFPIGASEALEQIDEIETRLSGLTQLMLREQAKSKVKLPEIIGLEELKGPQYLEQLLADARKIQDMELELGVIQGEYTREQAQIFVEDAEPIWIWMGDQWGHYMAQGLIDSKYLTEALKRREDEFSKIDVGFEEFDVPRDVLNQAIAQSKILGEQFSKYGYKVDLEDLITITNEGQVELNKADWKLVQYLLQQILETEKKQLDGIYNLPEGAGFYVPYQTLNLAYQKGLNEAAGGSLANLEDILSKLQFGPAPEQLAEGQPESGVTSLEDLKKTKSRYDDLIAREMATEGRYPTSIPAGERYLPSRVPRGLRGEREIPEPSLWDRIKSFLEDLRNIPWEAGNDSGDIDTLRENLRGMFETMSSNLSTALNLNVNSTTTLVVDGRVLAEVVKQYLHEDMIRYEGTTTLNRTVAI